MEKFLLAIFGPSWRTTLIGYLGAALIEAALGFDALPGNPAIWHVVALFVAAIGRAMKDSAVTGGSDPATKEAASRLGKLLVLVLAVGLAFAPGPARADDAPSLGVCFNKKSTICLRPIVGFSGAAYDFSQHQVVRSFEVSGLYELTIFPGKLGVAAGGGFQSGTVQGVAITALVTLPYSLALGVSELIVGGTASTSLTAGTVIRF